MKRLLSMVLLSATVLSGAVSHTNGAIASGAMANLTRVEALVENEKGAPVSGLSREDFEVSSEGQRQPIEAFSRESSSEPLTLVLLVDITASLLTGPGLSPLPAPVMTENYSIKGTLTSSTQVGGPQEEFDLQGFRPQDRVRLGSIGRRLTMADGFTSDAADIKKRWHTLFDVPPVEWLGPSPIWDAVAQAADALKNESGRRAIVLITDGQGSGNLRSHSEVAMRAALDGISVSVVALESMLPTMPLTSMASHGVDPTETLRNIAAFTGGSYRLAGAEFIAGDSTFTRHPAPLVKRALDELHQAYVIDFASQFTDGKPHALDVRVSTSGAAVRARRVYTAR